MHSFDLVLPYAEHLSYVGVFVYFAFLGYVIWIPEEIVMLAIGYVASVNGLSPYPALAVAVAGVLLGDNLLFYLSRHSSPHLRRFERKLSAGRLSKYRLALERHVLKTIVISRFVAGLRFLGPYLAGTRKVSWRQFFFLNAAVGMVLSTVFIEIGYRFQEQLFSIVRQITYWRHVIFIVVIVAVGYLVSRELMRYLGWVERREERKTSKK